MCDHSPPVSTDSAANASGEQPGPDSSDLHGTLTASATEALANLLRAHHLTTRREGAGVYVDDLRVVCRVVRTDRPAGAFNMQIDFTMWTDLLPDHPIFTPVSGFGDSWEAATNAALMDWLHRILDPVRAALGHGEPPHRSFPLAVNSPTGQTSWLLFQGDTVAVSMPVGGAPVPPLPDLTGERMPVVLILDALAGLLGNMSDRPLHWAKLFLARQVDGSRIVELQLDNTDWDRDLDKLNSFPWSDDPGYMMIKYFAAIIRQDVHDRLSVSGATPQPPAAGRILPANTAKTTPTAEQARPETRRQSGIAGVITNLFRRPKSR